MFGICKERACAVLLQRVKLGLVHRRHDGKRAAYIDAEGADVVV